MKKTFVLVLVVLCATVQQIFAVPAYPYPVSYQLPDGTEITIQPRGDEWVNWVESADGFTILRNSDGFWEYAVMNENGDLKLSGIRVQNEAERTVEVQIFLEKQPKRLGYSHSQIETILELRGVKNNFMERFEDAAADGRKRSKSVTGEVKIPVILVGFEGLPFTKTKEEFDVLLNQPNLTEGGLTGSLRDYYYDISYGQLTLKMEVFGPYELPNPISFYDNECVLDTATKSRGDSRRMALAAIDFAHEDGADFSTFYQIPGTNWLATVHIVFAGYCHAGSGSLVPHCESIWSHAWRLQQAIERDGVRISEFSVSPELRGYTGSNLARIGTFAHELGHSLLGLPDLYDVSYSSIITPDTWCLMGSGNFNDDLGRTPANLSAYGRVVAGWVPEITLASAASVTLPNPATADAVYRINTQTQGEYFLIENREKTKWDAFVPGSGMLIYHVDRSEAALNYWAINRVNANAERRRYYIKQAGGTSGSTSPDRHEDPWPQPGRSQFTDNSTPNSRSWAGQTTGRPITNITRDADAGTVSFNFMGGASHSVQLSEIGAYVFPSVNINYTSTTPLSVTINNIGSQPTGALNIALSGTNPSSFTLSKPTVSGIAVMGSDNFTITPNLALPTGTHTATVTVSGDNNISATFGISFTVNKTNGAMVAAPTLASVTHNTITVNPVPAPTNGQAVEYAIHTTNTIVNIDNLERQSGTTFTGLSPLTTYYVFARSAENDRFFAGIRSVSTAIVTLSGTSISELEDTQQLRIYPNPVTNGELKIEIGEWKSGDVVEIFDVNGKRVHSSRISLIANRLPLTINISHLPDGVYIVRIGDVVAKFVKQ
jgi:M6 family metalloprotease-like protein